MADETRHPFLHGLSKHRGSPPTVIVIFGVSGDLTARKLYGLSLRVVGSAEAAEDALQESFLQVWRSAGDYRAAVASGLRIARKQASIDVLKVPVPAPEAAK